MSGSRNDLQRRGFSILAGVFALAVAGTGVMAVRALAPRISDLSQFAAAGATGATTQTQSPTPQSLVSNIPRKQITVNGRNYLVYYECSLFTAVKDPSTLKLNCQPGFIYTLIEVNGTFRVDVRVDPEVELHPCTSPLPPAASACPTGLQPQASCPTDPSITGTIHYQLSAKSLSGATLSNLLDTTQKSFQLKCTQGQPLDFSSIRNAGANAYLSAAPDATVKSDVSNALSQYQLPLPNTTVGSAYDQGGSTGQAGTTGGNAQDQIAQIEQQRSNIQTQLQSYANCGDSSCSYAQQTLQQQDAALAQQEQVLKDQQAALSGNNSDTSGAPTLGTSASTLPQGQTFTGANGQQGQSASQADTSGHAIASDQGKSPASSLPTATGDWATTNADPALQAALDNAAARQHAQLTLQSQAEAYGNRMAYMNNSPTMQKIRDAVVATGHTPAEASAYVDQVVQAEAPLGATQAQMDSFLQRTYTDVVQQGADLNSQRLAALAQNNAPDYAGYAQGPGIAGTYNAYSTDAQGNVVYNPNGSTNVAQSDASGSNSPASAQSANYYGDNNGAGYNASQGTQVAGNTTKANDCPMWAPLCWPSQAFSAVSDFSAPYLQKLAETSGNTPVTNQGGNTVAASGGTETGVPWSSLNLTPSATAAEAPGSQNNAPDYASYTGQSSDGATNGAYDYYSTNGQGAVTYNPAGSQYAAQPSPGGNSSPTTQSPSFYGDTYGAGYNAQTAPSGLNASGATSPAPDTSQLPAVPVIGVTSEPLGPANPPSAIQNMQDLPSNASIQQQLATLGTKTQRADLVSNYFSNNKDLQNYTGSYDQNVALVKAVEQYGTTPPVPTPAPESGTSGTQGGSGSTVNVPVPQPAPAYTQPATQNVVDIGKIQATAQSFSGTSIVDFCAAAGYSCTSSSGQVRQDLAQLAGIQNYQPNTAGNTALLRALLQKYGQ